MFQPGSAKDAIPRYNVVCFLIEVVIIGLLFFQTYTARYITTTHSRKKTWAFVLNALLYLAIFTICCALQYFFALMHFDFTNNAEVRRYGFRMQRGANAQETIFALQRSVGLLLFSEVMIFVNFTFVIYDLFLVLLFYRYHLSIKEFKKLRDF